MMKPEGAIVISHPLGKSFIHSRSGWRASFPLEEFPEKSEAESLLKPFGFEIETFIDEPELYILVAVKRQNSFSQRARARSPQANPTKPTRAYARNKKQEH
jgi:hypothetical protein